MAFQRNQNSSSQIYRIPLQQPVVLPMPKFIEIYANLANEKPTDTRAHTQGPRPWAHRKPRKRYGEIERERERGFQFLLAQRLCWFSIWIGNEAEKQTSQEWESQLLNFLLFHFIIFFSFSLNRSLIVSNFSAFDDGYRFQITFDIVGFCCYLKFLNFPLDLLFLFLIKIYGQQQQQRKIWPAVKWIWEGSRLYTQTLFLLPKHYFCVK